MIGINESIKNAIIEIERIHEQCGNKNPNRCKYRHRPLVNELMGYDFVIEQRLRKQLTEEIMEMRNQWINMKESDLGEMAKWLKTGFEMALKVVEKK